MRKWLKFRPPEKVPKSEKYFLYAIEIVGAFLFCFVLYLQKRNGW